MFGYQCCGTRHALLRMNQQSIPVLHSLYSVPKWLWYVIEVFHYAATSRLLRKDCSKVNLRRQQATIG
jgi:hypothetical protein